MTQNDFAHIVASLNALSPEQMQKLRDELDSKLAAMPRKPIAQAPSASEESPTQAHKPYARAASIALLDKASTITAIEQLQALPPNWSGYTATPIDPRVIQAATEFILSLPGDIVATPKVVPMTSGRLQFEWHRGNRSLEIEFETSDRLHFLKWDSDVSVEEEGVISVDDTATVDALLRWFASEPVHV